MGELSLGQGFALSLQETVARLGSFELALHQAQSLTGREDWLALWIWSVQKGFAEVV